MVEVESGVGSTGSGEPRKLGPMDKFARPINPKASKAEAKRQQNINDALWKERTHQVQQYVARWVYTHAIPLDGFIHMLFHSMLLTMMSSRKWLTLLVYLDLVFSLHLSMIFGENVSLGASRMRFRSWMIRLPILCGAIPCGRIDRGSADLRLPA